MGKFRLAHLQEGQYHDARILKPETARQMHMQSYTFDPALPGISHGFVELSLNGQRLLCHGSARRVKASIYPYPGGWRARSPWNFTWWGAV